MPARRIMVELTPEQQERLRQAQQETEQELPELVVLGKSLRRAAQEETLSGSLRRAIHASPLDLDVLAERAGITPDGLQGFLTGEHPLPSDAMDRLAAEVGCQLVQPV